VPPIFFIKVKASDQQFLKS